MNYFSDITIVNVARQLLYMPERNIMSDPSCSIEFIRSGSVILERNNRRQLLKGPLLTWILSNEPFRFINREENFYEHQWINFSGPRAERIISSLNSNFAEGYIELNEATGKAVSLLMMSMLNDFRSDPQLYRSRIAFTLENLLWQVLSYLEPLPREDFSDRHGINNLMQNIALNPFDVYDFDQIAEEMKISLTHLRRIFHDISGMALHKYIRKQQMLYAATLLESGKVSVKAVAISCGFADLSAFSRIFKAQIGCAPRTFWQRSRGRI
ncbi:MAG: AraC family transcriptional regulator [Victivallaceae bacterium]